MNSKFIKVFIPAFLLFYFTLGNATLGTEAFFPLDAWTIFVKVPNKIENFSLRIHSREGKEFIPPISLREIKEYRENPDMYTVKNTIVRLGYAVEKGEEEKINQLRELLESYPFFGENAHYEIVKETYTPLDRWWNEEYKQESIAHFYTKEE